MALFKSSLTNRAFVIPQGYTGKLENTKSVNRISPHGVMYNQMSPEELRSRMSMFLQTDYSAYFFLEDHEVVGYALVDECRRRSFSAKDRKKC